MTGAPKSLFADAVLFEILPSALVTVVELSALVVVVLLSALVTTIVLPPGVNVTVFLLLTIVVVVVTSFDVLVVSVERCGWVMMIDTGTAGPTLTTVVSLVVTTPDTFVII